MSRVAEGTYCIISRVLSADGQKLAMTFCGKDQAIKVTYHDSSSSAQKWVIVNHPNGLQYVKPKDNQSLEAGWGKYITTMPHGGYVWGITQDNGFVIKDGGKSIAWSLDNASKDSSVVPKPDSSEEKQRWIFEKC